jgi:hypothetical protein
MKKLALGCAVVLGLGAGGVAAASWYAYHKVSSTFAGFAQLGTLPELERSVRKQGPYTPPPSGEPSPEQLDVAAIITDVKQGREPAMPAHRMTIGPTGSPAVQKLVEPHRKALADNAGLAFFGL